MHEARWRPAVGVLGEPVRPDELGREQAGHPLLAARDLELDRVLLLGPFDRKPELAERLVERDAVAVPLGVSEDAVAIEDQRAHQARPWAPNFAMCSFAISSTAARWATNSFGGSYSVGWAVT